MRVLWLFAHPDQRSLSAALRDEGLRALSTDGHDYALSDLYAMGWNPVVDVDDFGHDPAQRLIVGKESRRALHAHRLSADIRAEQAKLTWADTVIVQFPLWWYGMPAMLKGWFDRVFVKGLAYGVRDEQTGRMRRYGDGLLVGKRAMVVLTLGAPAQTIGPRGINGQLDQLLFPLQHGTLWYAGMSVLPPVVVAEADRLSADDYAAYAAQLRRRVQTLESTAPIPFRRQAGGDYDDALVLRSEHAPGHSGLAIHRTDHSADLAHGNTSDTLCVTR